jgi:hypothetical protein
MHQDMMTSDELIDRPMLLQYITHADWRTVGALQDGLLLATRLI